MPNDAAHEQPSILVLNSGSSSLKAALFALRPEGDPERPLLEANATGIGQSSGKLVIAGADGEPLADDPHTYQSQTEALEKIAGSLRERGAGAPAAIGHRIVHGGMHLTRHQRLTASVLRQLEQATHFAPLHIPSSLALIRRSEELYQGVPQFACFDTAFHQTLPEAAWRLPLPDAYAEQGLRRYGFHGLSYESIVAQLRAEPARLPERIVVAHLGSGSSLAALLRGRSIDTSMAFTPAGGVPMATRTGDLDPGVLIYLQRTAGLTLDEVEALVNHDAGLKALAGSTPDMQKLEASAADQSAPRAANRAALAIDIFAAAVAKTVAAYIVSLEGLDLLVFTGGIGEHSAAFRAGIVDRLRPLGVALDPDRNARHAGTLSSAGSRVVVRVLPAQEDLQIARHVRTLLAPERPRVPSEASQ